MGYVNDAAGQYDVFRSIILLELAYLILEAVGGQVSAADAGFSLPDRHVGLVGGEWGEILVVKSQVYSCLKV